MGGDRTFWLLFGGIWMVVGLGFLAATAGINVFADPAALNNETPAWVFAAAGVAATAFGGFILRRTFVASARERRLKQSGMQVTATVADIRRSMVEINRQTRWYLCYRYDYGGRPFTGESGAMPGALIADFKPGDHVTIMVDPRKPEDSLFLGAE